MLLTIQNGTLSLTVDTMGAEMMSLRSGNTEYLWQGDPQYWSDRAPTLFPFIGRLTNNRYQFHGKTYPMSIHGFAAQSEFTVEEHTMDRLELSLGNSLLTLVQYPFDFTFLVIYQLKENSLVITYRVQNKNSVTMPFGIGGHPGFRVPLEEDECFEDYTLEFSQTCQPDRVGFTPAVFLNGHDKAYPLEDGKYLPLRHDLFDEDAIILKNMARKVTLRSKTSSHRITVSYPQMPYLGIWHWPNTDAPYVCIEPWTSLPARQDVVEEFSCKSDLVQLEPGEIYENTWSITISREEN